MRIAITYRNVGRRWCSPDHCAVFMVKDANDAVVWDPLQACPAYKSFMAPGQSVSGSIDWDQRACTDPSPVESSQSPCSGPRAAPGTYRAVLEWDSYGPVPSAPFQLT